MSITIDNVFVKQFEADVHLAYQQMGTKLRATVRSKSGVVDVDNYTVQSGADMSGGTVILTMAPVVGTRIDIIRKTTLSRVIDYQSTKQIDPENLNTDFNLLMAAIQDLNISNDDWQRANEYHDMMTFLEYTNNLISDKMSGGGTLGIYKNLVSVLDGALPALINDYGLITDSVPNENCDDYGIL